MVYNNSTSTVHHNNTNVLTTHMGFTHPVSIVFCLLTLLGMLCALAIKFVLVKYRHTPLVKASNFKMSAAQIVAHIAFFGALLLLFVKPEEKICTARPIVLGILFTFIAAITLTKTQKLVFIFQARIRISRKQVQMSQTMELFLIFLLMSIQSVIAVLSFYLNKNQHVVMILSKESKKESIIKCDTDEEFMMEFLFAVLLIFMCLMQAFKARNLPENFNETKFIVIATFLCLMLVGLFLPVRLLSSSEVKFFCDAYLLFSTNAIMLLVMYCPKCWIILRRPAQNTQVAFKQNLKIHAFDRVTKSMNRCVSSQQRTSAASVHSIGESL